jgi:hypothetical protein
MYLYILVAFLITLSLVLTASTAEKKNNTLRNCELNYLYLTNWNFYLLVHIFINWYLVMAFKAETPSTHFGYELFQIAINVIDDLSPFIIVF